MPPGKRQDLPPGLVAQEVEKMVARAGLGWTRVLGLTIAQWTSLVTALLTALFGYLVGTLLARTILPMVTRRTESDLDDTLLARVGAQAGLPICLAAQRYVHIPPSCAMIRLLCSV